MIRDEERHPATIKMLMQAAMIARPGPDFTSLLERCAWWGPKWARDSRMKLLFNISLMSERDGPEDGAQVGEAAVGSRRRVRDRGAVGV